MDGPTADLIGKKFPVLNDGHVVLIDVMGSDSDICDAARISYGKGTKKKSEDRDLIRYLYRNRHTTPFEMAEIKLAIRVPMDTWRQWIRHRTASVNEYSTRYSEAIDSRQETPSDGWRAQATVNKQGSSGKVEGWPDGYHLEMGGVMVYHDPPKEGHGGRVQPKSFYPPDSLGDTKPGHYLSYREAELHGHAAEVYEERLKFGVAREQARKDLPLSTYTEAYWKCDLKNLLGFLALRMDSHAQLEIREYANVIGREIVAPLFPETWSAFEDYTLGAMTFSAIEVAMLRKIGSHLEDGHDAMPRERLELDDAFPNIRERGECLAKFQKLGLVS